HPPPRIGIGQRIDHGLPLRVLAMSKQPGQVLFSDAVNGQLIEGLSQPVSMVGRQSQGLVSAGAIASWSSAIS
ncbi:MAG: hypothetical protein AAGJ52_13050, partial [Pseudomonadota bacterium]